MFNLVKEIAIETWGLSIVSSSHTEQLFCQVMKHMNRTVDSFLNWGWDGKDRYWSLDVAG